MSQRMPDYEALRERQARSQESIVTAPRSGRLGGKIGDKVGYAVVKLNPFGQWLETDCPQMDTIGQAAGMVTAYEQARPESTFAVARLELVMISRPDERPAP